MSFSVEDFPSLLRLLSEHPEWRDELRRQLLTEELLALPALVAQQAEHLAAFGVRLETLIVQVDALTAQVGTLTAQVDALTAQVDALTAQVGTLTARVDELAARVDELASRMDTLALRMDTLASNLGALTVQVGALAGRAGTMEGELLELRYARLAPVYFSRLARRLKIIEPSDLADMLDGAVDEGKLTGSEREKVLAADLVLSGRRREDQAPIYLLAEVSVGIGQYDVERAAERAAILVKLGLPVTPVVAGYWINPEAEAQAAAFGVLPVLTRRKPTPAEV